MFVRQRSTNSSGNKYFTSPDISYNLSTTTNSLAALLGKWNVCIISAVEQNSCALRRMSEILGKKFRKYDACQQHHGSWRVEGGCNLQFDSTNMCLCVPKFVDNCVFGEYGIIYYWIY